MRGDSRLNGRGGSGYGRRFWSAVVLVAISLFWGAQGVAAWAAALCWSGVVVGVVAAGYFGWQYLRGSR